MKNSQLVAILKRLSAMVESNDSEVQVRRFEREGEEKCIVTFDSSNEMFELTETGSQQVYQFDDIDLVALEIFELLQD
ncbi:MAG: YkuJ family protein [Vagococcus sp.]